MNFKGCIPVKQSATLPSHYGPGSQWGKPYYHLGQEYERPPRSRSCAGSPLDLSRTAKCQTTLNRRVKERHLRVFGDPPSARSCVVSCNKDGTAMDSLSHYTKVGSKHMCGARPDHHSSLSRSHSEPGVPWGQRRSLLRDPTPWYFNAAFTTTSDGYGKFYHSPVMANPSLLPRERFDWLREKESLR
mmetsp:Transcript_60539/g.131188  ORF Transcript_60539/g.131188 Transcript_60539/m.131188 type:complete len:187 (-) Transcript_60539:212-772(-)